MDGSKTHTEVNWRDGSVPVSPIFDDAFFAYHDGRAETSEVFIAGNALPERWAEGRGCNVAELGFGTGLNFLETVRQWRTVAMRHGRRAAPRLTFTSFELYPIPAEAMLQSLARWADLAPFAADLIQRWPPAGPGLFEIETFAGLDVCLRVHVGDARATLPSAGLTDSIDAWYLDGFSPAKNPELWGVDLLTHVFRTTRAGGTFSTYTAAGWVRRNLANAGFEVRKVKGYAAKRERLSGVKRQAARALPDEQAP
ncbi:MAG: tRNA (5-methylaminomethyl-2-thiouridine)(34)-methyltransferase MnmD [Hyphomicrobiaceae bacterium]